MTPPHPASPRLIPPHPQVREHLWEQLGRTAKRVKDGEKDDKDGRPGSAADKGGPGDATLPPMLGGKPGNFRATAQLRKVRLRAGPWRAISARPPHAAGKKGFGLWPVRAHPPPAEHHVTLNRVMSSPQTPSSHALPADASKVHGSSTLRLLDKLAEDGENPSRPVPGRAQRGEAQLSLCRVARLARSAFSSS